MTELIMARHFNSLLSLILVLALGMSLVSCDDIKKNFSHFYSISWDYNSSYNGGDINVTMHYPSGGLGGFYWGDDGNNPDDVEKDIYDEINPAWYDIFASKKTGIWHLYLTLQEKDQYGNWKNGITRMYIGDLNCYEVQKYQDYKYFYGTVTRMIVDGYERCLRNSYIQ